MQQTSPRRWVILIVGSVLAALVLAQVAARLAAPVEEESPLVGLPAPVFSAETVQGERIALADYRGKSAVLLKFYANY